MRPWMCQNQKICCMVFAIVLLIKLNEKSIPANSVRFMLHSQKMITKNEYIRKAELSWIG